MALSGSVSTNNWVSSETGNTMAVRLDWTATQNIEKNQTTINWKLVGDGNLAGWVYVSELRVKFDGEEIYHRSHSDHTECYDGTVLKSGSHIVTHNGDGTRSVTMSVEAGIYNWAINKSGSRTFTLNTIARASAITSVGNVTLGNACSVSWTPASSGFRYYLKFQIGSWSKDTEWIYPNRTSSYSYKNYTIPLDVASYIPNSESGTMTVYLYTYNGSTKIGSTDSDTFTVYIPSSVKPSMSSVSISLVNSNPVINGWNVGVAGYSKIKVTASASGSYGSTIESFNLSGCYSGTKFGNSLSFTGDTITSSGDKSISVTAKDSRKRTSSAKSTGTIVFYPYSIPRVSYLKADRTGEGSQSISVEASWSYASVNGHNSATGVLFYKLSTSSSWTRYGEIPRGTKTLLSGAFEEGKSYNFKIVVTDALQNQGQEEVFVSTIAVLMDFRAGGKGLGIGKIAETDSMEVALPARFMSTVYIYDSGKPVTLADYIRSVVGK